jgi:hypothetical protein
MMDGASANVCASLPDSAIERQRCPVLGRVGIWGVYGVPKNFVIAKDGRIAHKQIGPITPEVLQAAILPMVRRLQQ